MAKDKLSLFISLAAMIPKVFAESGIMKILASYMAAKQGGANSFSLDVTSLVRGLKSGSFPAKIVFILGV